MYIRSCIFMLPYMVVIAIFGSWAFNIDMANPHIYTGAEKDFFGYDVLQFMSVNKSGVLVTAPLRENGTGGICRCLQNGCTECYTPPVPAKTSLKNFGLSISEEPSHPNRFTSCSPSLAHECYDNTYLNSECIHFNDQLQPISTQRPVFQDCTEKSVNLVFLFDGSASMTTNEFNKNKDFIIDIMKSLKNSSIKFAAVQFSTETSTVFNFNDYQSGTAVALLQNEVHMKALTHTHAALKYVLENIFQQKTAGGSPDAIKVVVIITDGSPSDSPTDICKTYDENNIIRFVIGIIKTDNAVTLDKLHAVASEPKENNTFRINNYDGLAGILKNFEKKIFNIEGSSTALAGNLADEMSQSGFSSAYYKNTLVLGSVGSNNWRGALHELQNKDSVGRSIQDPKMTESSYMGYSVAAGEKNSEPLYFTGAPRFDHTGQVVLFKPVHNIWTVAHRVNGSQIGSYFGAELCTVDVDSDNNIDFLLVGAPLFHQPREKREGLVYVYTVTDELELKMELNISVPSRGRFGTTISSLSDLNGDLLRDVAVGAPLEDDNRGAVYIYLGDKSRGICSTYSQRIMAEKINPRLQFFGQAIDGRIDLNEDGLPDIVVGSHGRAVVLWSRPVISVSAHLSFEPPEISTDHIDCLGNRDTILPMITLTACFDVAESTHSKDGHTGLNITYNLDVDPMRQNSRGFFNTTEKRARSFHSTVELNNKTCFKHTINMMKCVKDTLYPVMIKLELSQHDSENATAILNVDSIKHVEIEAPFEKTCRKNDSCIAELEVDFNFTTKTLLVAQQNYVRVNVRFSNTGDDSYNTSLTLHYPAGLSFSTLNLKQATRATLHRCSALEGLLDRTVCSVSLPVYRSRTSATFEALFQMINTYEWSDTMSMTITGKSDNANSTRGSMTKTIPVQIQIDLAASVNDDTVSNLKFTPEENQSKRLLNIYEVKNLGFKPVPVNVSLIIPTKLNHNFEMNNYQVSVQENKTQCVDTINMTSDYCSADKHCKLIKCATFILKPKSSTRFIFSGDVAFMNLKQQLKDMALIHQFTGYEAEVLFKSFIDVHYEIKRYIQVSRKFENEDNLTNKDFPHAQIDVRVELILFPNEMLIYGTAVGAGFILLFIVIVIMFKMGCFKSKTAQDYKENHNAMHCTSSPPASPSAVSVADPQPYPAGPAEEKALVSNNGENKPSMSTANA